MQEFNITNRQKNVIFVVALILIVLIGWNIQSSLQKSGTVPVTVERIPKDSNITIDGAGIGNGSTVNLAPGVYEFTVAREGYATRTFTQTVSSEEQNAFSFVLAAETEEARKSADPNAYHDVSSGDVIDPILDQLPIKNLIISIDVVSWDDLKPAEPVNLVISAAAGYRSGALNKIRELGFDISNYRYTFTNYEDPFK